MELFITKRGIAKLKVGLCRGKKNYDKKESIKKKDIERQVKQEIAWFFVSNIQILKILSIVLPY